MPSSPPKAADHSVVDLIILVPSSVGYKVRSHKKPSTAGCSAMLTRPLPNTVCGALSRCSIAELRSLLKELCIIVPEHCDTVLEVVVLHLV